MPSLLKKKPFAKPAQKEKTDEAKKAPLLKLADERPIPVATSPKQSEDSFLAFTIQRKHDGVTFLYELVQIKVVKGVVTVLRRDPGTTRDIVESKIYRDLSEILF